MPLAAGVLGGRVPVRFGWWVAGGPSPPGRRRLPCGRGVRTRAGVVPVDVVRWILARLLDAAALLAAGCWWLRRELRSGRREGCGRTWPPGTWPRAGRRGATRRRPGWRCGWRRGRSRMPHLWKEVPTTTQAIAAVRVRPGPHQRWSEVLRRRSNMPAVMGGCGGHGGSVARAAQTLAKSLRQ
jgi:hypothetical protein